MRHNTRGFIISVNDSEMRLNPPTPFLACSNARLKIATRWPVVVILHEKVTKTGNYW